MVYGCFPLSRPPKRALPLVCQSCNKIRLLSLALLPNVELNTVVPTGSLCDRVPVPPCVERRRNRTHRLEN